MKTVRYGSRGEEVKTLQSALNRAGCNLEVDGQFGPATLEAVKAYQRRNNLEVDGIAGPATWASLERDYFTDLGKAITGCLSGIEKLPEFKKLMEMI